MLFSIIVGLIIGEGRKENIWITLGLRKIEYSIILFFIFMRTGEVFAVQAELLTLRSSAIPEGAVVSTLRMGIFLLI